MDAATRRKIGNIIGSLSSVQSDLITLSNQIRQNCKGIGENDCANAIEEVASDCGKAKSYLYHL